MALEQCLQNVGNNRLSLVLPCHDLHSVNPTWLDARGGMHDLRPPMSSLLHSQRSILISRKYAHGK